MRNSYSKCGRHGRLSGECTWRVAYIIASTRVDVASMAGVFQLEGKAVVSRSHIRYLIDLIGRRVEDVLQ
jgi:hypothetical protein